MNGEIIMSNSKIGEEYEVCDEIIRIGD